jgi:ribose 5-phosphate isomerase A
LTSSSPGDVDPRKLAAARAALAEVRDGMLVGLGSGSTSELFVVELARRVAAGLNVACVATSERVAALARQHGLLLGPLDGQRLDLTVDGADEIEPRALGLVKGRGGSLLREKVVAVASARLVIIADASKLVATLGERAPVPVEVVRSGWETTAGRIEALGCTATLRDQGSQAVVTDEGHHILDCRFAPIADPPGLAAALKGIVGVVEHGLFLGLARRAYVASDDGVLAFDAPGA